MPVYLAQENHEMQQMMNLMFLLIAAEQPVKTATISINNQ